MQQIPNTLTANRVVNEGYNGERSLLDPLDVRRDGDLLLNPDRRAVCTEPSGLANVPRGCITVINAAQFRSAFKMLESRPLLSKLAV